MVEARVPQQYNPDAARPAGAPVEEQNVGSVTLPGQTVENGNVYPSEATLPDGTQISWGQQTAPQEQQVQQPPTTFVGETYQGLDLAAAKALREEENKQGGSAGVSYIDGQPNPNREMKDLPDNPAVGTADMYYSANYDVDAPHNIPEDVVDGGTVTVTSGEGTQPKPDIVVPHIGDNASNIAESGRVTSAEVVDKATDTADTASEQPTAEPTPTTGPDFSGMRGSK